jgi:acetyltransferase-like isoleucine patch superfamily enzyme
MIIPYRLISTINKLQVAYWSKSFKGKCNSSGGSLQVKGPFRVLSTGSLHVGSHFILDSSKERPVRIEIGTQAELSIGNHVYFNEGAYIVCNISVQIGNNCLFASDVVILDDDGHPVDWHTRHNHWPKQPQDRLGAPVIIEDNVWVGTRAIILKGVRIGTGSVIAAGAVVTHDVPPMCVAGGVPAGILRKL